MRAGAASLGALPLFVLLGASGPLEESDSRFRLGAIFGVGAQVLPALQVEVEAIESSDRGRQRLAALERDLVEIFSEWGVPVVDFESNPDALVVTCRLGLSPLDEAEVGWGLFRWHGSCDLSWRGRIGITTARAGGASHPNLETARANARDAARESLVSALRERLDELMNATAS